MKAKFSRPQPSCLWLAALLLAWPALIQAQAPFPTPAPPPDPLAGIPVQVLDQRQVTLGTHTITYNRIAPPGFPAATPTPKATDHAAQVVPARKAADRSAWNHPQKATPSAQSNGEGEKPRKMLLLSATVYDHQFTELRWNDGAGAGLRAYVNLDFAYFTTVTSLETADTVYDLMFAWSNDTAASLT